MTLRRELRRFGRSESGATALYVAAFSAVMLGAGALAVDLGRLMTLNSELQSAADAAALAGAAELNGEPGAQARAVTAATGAFGTNVQTFATDDLGAAVTVPPANIRFLRSLPADDQPIGAADIATGDEDSRFIEVTVPPRRFDSLLLGFIGNQTSFNTAASAVAGYTQVVCNFPPLMMCNPYEATHGAGASFSPVIGQMILLKTHGSGTGAWAPGDFGLLDPPSVDDPGSNTGAKAVAEQIAAVSPNACYSARVTVRPGVVNSMRSALNVRFDIYENPFFTAAKNDPQYRPAPNVTMGLLRASACKLDDTRPPPNVALGFPRDDCFPTADGTKVTNTCSFGRFGDTNWDRTSYWDTNHPGTAAPPGYGAMTRYETYEWEIANEIPDNSGVGGENGNPQCYSGGAPPFPERRVLHVAVINCVEHGVNGGSNPPLPVEAFAKFFLTEPVNPIGNGSDTDIYAELIDVLEPGEDDDVLHDIVQLYR